MIGFSMVKVGFFGDLTTLLTHGYFEIFTFYVIMGYAYVFVL